MNKWRMWRKRCRRVWRFWRRTSERLAAALTQAEQYRQQVLDLEKRLARSDAGCMKMAHGWDALAAWQRHVREAWASSEWQQRIRSASREFVNCLTSITWGDYEALRQAIESEPFKGEATQDIAKVQGSQPSAEGGVDVSNPPHDWTAGSSPADKPLGAELRKCLEIVQTSLLHMTRLARVRRAQVQALRWLVDNGDLLAHRRLTELWQTRHEGDMLLAERDELRAWQKRVCHAWVGFEYRDLPAAKHLDQAIKSGPDV